MTKKEVTQCILCYFLSVNYIGGQGKNFRAENKKNIFLGGKYK